MNTALKKINARVKVLQKKHPKTKRTSLMKQAGREYRTGKLSGVKKRRAAPKKRKAAPRKKATKRLTGHKRVTTRRKSAHKRKATKARVIVIRTVGAVKKPRRRRRVSGRKRSYKPVRVQHCSRVGSKKSNVGLIVGIGVGLGVLYLLTRSNTTVLPPGTALLNSSNIARNQAASSIVQYATAAGAGVAAITNLINALNTSSDSQVMSYASTVQNTGSLPAALPDISADVQAPSTSQALNFGL